MNDFDPLALVKKYLLEKKVEERTYNLIIDRMNLVEGGINRIEQDNLNRLPILFYRT